jgi:methionyl-tRNA formyltransferase
VVVAPLRIVYFGTPAFAVPPLGALLSSRHPVVTVVSQPDRPKGRGQQLHLTPTHEVADAHGIPVLQPARIRDELFLDSLRALSPDLGVVAAFGRILPDSLLAIPRLGLINVHASILPRYRGAAPVQRAVLAGDHETGVTIMRVISELDAGPTFAVARVPIAPDATTGDVEADVARAGAAILLDVVEDLAAGRAVETPQDATQATYAPKVTKDEGVVAWTRTANAIHDQIRGLQPWPLASSRLGGARYVLRRSVVTGDSTDREPGVLTEAHGDILSVACGEGTVLRLLEIQPEGRRPMSAREFLAGRRLAAGDRFEP